MVFDAQTLTALLFNFSLLVTCAFTVSLTYQDWPLRHDRSDIMVRVGLGALSAFLLMLFAVEQNGYRFDLRLVPVALIAMRYGLPLGLLAYLPILLWRFMEGGVTGTSLAAINIVAVLGAIWVFRRPLRPLSSSTNQWWFVPLPFVGVNLLLWVLPDGGSIFWQVYLSGLVLNTLGLAVSLALLHSRFQLLRITHAFRLQALTDALTGLGNRRQFETDLSALPAGSQLVLLDLDHFKSINDRYGHDFGDRVLRGLGTLLATEPRKQARVYRIGGEEFALMLTGITEARACQDVDTLLQQVARQGLLLAGLEPSGVEAGGAGPPRLTLSAGLATRHPDESPQRLFRRADEALYLAKTNGRNRLVASPTPVEVAPHAPQTPALPTPNHAIQPRHTLWQALRTTIDLLSQRRSITDDDWAELMRLAIACVDGAEAGSMNVREGRHFRLCAVEGHPQTLVGLHLSEASQLRWYGRSITDWRAGVARVLMGNEFQEVWTSSDELHTAGQDEVFRHQGRRQEVQASLCLPVVLAGEVVAHLNLESYSSTHVFTPDGVEVAGVFAQQLAALLQFQQHWHELDLLAGLHLQLHTDCPQSAGDSSDTSGQERQDLRLEQHLTDAALDLLGAHQATLLRYDPLEELLTSQVIEGHYQTLGPVRLSRHQDQRALSWQALDTGQVVRVGDAQADTRVYRHTELDHDAMMVVPLFSRMQDPLGVLIVTRDSSRPFQTADEHLGLMLASVGARLLERNAHLADLHATLEAALNTLGVALEVRDFETQGHTQRVQQAAHRMGMALDLPDERMGALRHGAALHDIGKLGIPDSVLLKPGRLTPEERLVVETHTVIGAELAARIPYLHAEAHTVIRSHHERWDGLGYPDNLSGEAIPLLARLFSLCDVYDSLVSTRPYKEAMDPAQAIDIIRQGRGTQFDPELTDLFIALWEQGQFGPGEAG